MPTARTTSTVILSSPVLSTTDDGAAPREEHWDVPSSDSSIPDIKSLIKKTKKINAQKAPTETGLANEELAEAVAAPKKRGRPKKVSDDVVQEGGSVKAAPKKRTTKKTTEMATGGKRTTGSKKKEKAAAESRFFDKLPKTKAGAATKAKGTKEEPIVLDEKTPPPRRRRDWTPVTDTIPAAPVTPKEDFSTTSPVGSGSEGSTSSVEKRKASLLDKLDGYRFSGTLSADKTPVATPLKGTIKRRKIGVIAPPPKKENKAAGKGKHAIKKKTTVTITSLANAAYGDDYEGFLLSEKNRLGKGGEVLSPKSAMAIVQEMEVEFGTSSQFMRKDCNVETCAQASGRNSEGSASDQEAQEECFRYATVRKKATLWDAAGCDTEDSFELGQEIKPLEVQSATEQSMEALLNGRLNTSESIVLIPSSPAHEVDAQSIQSEGTDTSRVVDSPSPTIGEEELVPSTDGKNNENNGALGDYSTTIPMLRPGGSLFVDSDTEEVGAELSHKGKRRPIRSTLWTPSPKPAKNPNAITSVAVQSSGHVTLDEASSIFEKSKKTLSVFADSDEDGPLMCKRDSVKENKTSSKSTEPTTAINESDGSEFLNHEAIPTRIGLEGLHAEEPPKRKRGRPKKSAVEPAHISKQLVETASTRKPVSTTGIAKKTRELPSDSASNSNMPDYNSMDTEQLSLLVNSYGFKCPKSKKSMVTILTEIWEKQHQDKVSSRSTSVQLASSAVVKTEDANIPPASPTLPTEETDFKHAISTILTTHSSSNPSARSYYTQILTYTPLAIDEFTIWLNETGLGLVGLTDEVAIKTVREWANERGVCVIASKERDAKGDRRARRRF